MEEKQVGPQLSQSVFRLQRMKIKHLVDDPKDNGRLIARFGTAALIKKQRGCWLLQGGSRSDKIEAREWISLFMHEAVVHEN
jgi:hypothetical protein